MDLPLIVALASIVVLGMGAQWLSWRLRLPSILLLLLFGFAAGPTLRPDELFGDLLLPLVSLSVGLILFEGGMSLRLTELREIGATVRNLILVGGAVTWVVSAATGALWLGLDVRLALLLGAILVVTGPTVIIPLLRQIRPSRSVSSILRWEGILIDPIGATLALLVFEAILAGEAGAAATTIVIVILKTLAAGGLLGAAGAFSLTQTLKRFFIPDFLQSPAALAVVLAVFVAANQLQEGSGLLAVTVMGVLMANQRSVEIRHIAEFKENLQVLLISGLFIVLAARLSPADVAGLPLPSLAFVAALVLFARPAGVALATLGSKLSWRERLFLACVAPRGIVAAAVASVFTLRLTESASGLERAELVAPITFLVIIVTVALYGLSAPILARRLKLAQPDPQGVLILGAHSWARALAAQLQKEGFTVLLADGNWANVSAARMEGLNVYYGNVLSEQAEAEIDLAGIGRLLALSANEGINSLACMQFAHVLGRAHVFQLPSGGSTPTARGGIARRLQGRELFSPAATYWHLSGLFVQGAGLKRTDLTPEFDFEAFRKHYGEAAVPLAVVEPGAKLRFFTVDADLHPQPGHAVLSLVKAVPEAPVAPPEAAAVNA